MQILIIGNIITLIASVLMVYTGYVKSREKILYVQTIETLLYALGDFILSGFTGAIINVINTIRNILCYKEKLTKPIIAIIIIISLGLTIGFNTQGILGYLPFISSTIYILFMNIKNVIKFKVLIIVTMILWLIYDICIKAYTSTCFDTMCILAGIISIIQIKRGKVKNNNKEKSKSND